MRILIAGNVYYPAMNGQAVFTEGLTEGLAKRGHEVVSILPSETGQAYHQIRNNVRIEALKSGSLTNVHADAYYSFFSKNAIERIIRRFKPEVVHIQDHFPVSWDAVQAARQQRVPLIGTNHFMPENLAAFVPLLPKIKPVYQRIMWSWMLTVYNLLDVATAQSKASAGLLRDEGLRIPVQPVSCGIDLSRFHPDSNVDRKAMRVRYGLNPDKTIFLFVGRVDHEKRLDVLLRAMQLLKRDDVQLAIAGKGIATEELKRLANELGLGEKVHFTGFVPAEDLPALLNSVDIFSMPSEAELLSIASLEAMACGKPVLLANAVALPELAGDGVNGYLFRPGDAADAARRMALLADHPERWARMGAGSREKALYHSMENTLKQYEVLYANLVAGVYAPTSRDAIKSLRSLPDWLSGNKK